jgi:excisionase family DNA binding protein
MTVRCHCGNLATGAIFMPSLSQPEYVVAVCDRHDILGEGDYFALVAMSQTPATFLRAFEQQVIADDDENLRGWLVEAGRDVQQKSALTVSEAARAVNLSERAMQRLCASGALGKGAWRTSEGARASWRINAAALDHWKGRVRARSVPSVRATDVSPPRRGSKAVVW